MLVASMDDYAAVNKVYAKCKDVSADCAAVSHCALIWLMNCSSDFTKDFPARAAFAVKTLPKNALVEVEAIAIAK